MITEIKYIDWYAHFEAKKIGLLSKAKHYRFSNFSAIKIPETDKFLYAAKCLFIDSEREGFFRPGNAPGVAYSEDSGLDFWWNRWGESRGGIVFFAGNHVDELQVIEVDPSSDARSFRGVLIAGDLRLCSCENEIFAHTPDLKVFRISIDGDRVRLSFVLSANCGIDDRNMSLLQLDPLLYLDWFRDRGLVLKKETACHEIEHSIPYDKDFGLRGTGSCMGDIYRLAPYPTLTYEKFLEAEREHFGDNFGITPHLCFGSPGIPVTHPVYGSGFLGVGHSKIWNNPGAVYLYESSIWRFRHIYHLEMKKHFGDLYIKHFGRGCASGKVEGFLYLFFFFFVNSDLSKCYLSNSYLPFGKKDIHGPFDQDYQFGLVFPQSLLQIDQHRFAVTMGVGDWYSVWCELDAGEVFAELVHDSSRLNMNNYRFQILTDHQQNVPKSLKLLVR